MPDFLLELAHDGPVCGIDEVGRGPLAGPVVAACVYVPPNARDLPFWSHINDSKKINKNKRLELDSYIKNHSRWGIGQASVDEIDKINILQATFLAMERAYLRMIETFLQIERSTSPFQGEGWGGGHIKALLDGNRAPRQFPVPVQCVIRGDATSLSIAAASIIAKVVRDQIMTDLHTEFPKYGWADNAGYGTPAHLAALALHGPCPHHRQTFAPVRAALSLAK